MPFSLIQSGAASDTDGDVAVTLGSPVTAGSYIVAGASAYGGAGGISSIVLSLANDAATVLSIIGGVPGGNSQHHIRVVAGFVTAGGTLTVTASGATNARFLTVAEFANNGTVPTIATAFSANFGNAVNSGSLSPDGSDVLVWGQTFSESGVGPFTPNATFTELQDVVAGPMRGFTQYRILTGATAVATSPTGSGSSGEWLAGLITFTANTASSLTQFGYRFYNDDDNVWFATPAEAENTGIQQPILTPKRLRIGIDGTGDPASAQFQLEYRKVGDLWWRKV